MVEAVNVLNKQAVTEILGKQITHELILAAEPFIKETMVKVEAKLRERVAVMAVAIVKKDFSINHNGSILELRVNLGSTKDGQ